MRAVSINCSGAASVSSMVKPNDHVDVIGTFDFDRGDARKKNFVTCTILQNVLVLATGSRTAKTRAKDRFSEHAQCLALLADVLPPDRAACAFAGLTEAMDLAPTTVYFSHYLFETYSSLRTARLSARSRCRTVWTARSSGRAWRRRFGRARTRFAPPEAAGAYRNSAPATR